MRVRPMDSTGDYTIGVPFLVNSPQCVAQCIRTRLKHWRNEWFIDTTAGTPYMEDVLAERAGKDPDSVIQERILSTQGVTEILDYLTSFDPVNRKYTINAQVMTQYSSTPITISEVL
jgi:hypothetical protein